MKFEVVGKLTREVDHGRRYALVLSEDRMHIVKLEEWLVDAMYPGFPQELLAYRGKRVRVTVELMD